MNKASTELREAGGEEASLEVIIIITQVGHPLAVETVNDTRNEDSA